VVAGQGTVMEQTFFEHYRICDNEDGSPVSRSGAALNYRAIDTRSHQPVLLQLIPLAIVDQTQREQFEERARTAQKLDHINIARIFAVGAEHDHFGLVSEYLDGETADSWVVAHGPMPADAVLRVGLQVARALATGAFFGLTHRAIQPSNLMIVPGQSVDGGWPFVKLLNFGLAGLELHSNSAEARELAPSMAPQFASPEQLLNREIDFRSEVYSLGASMCFLLTGAAPLSAHGMKARLRLRRLPELRHSPRALRNLLTHMLRENPENRPQDPVAFESEIQECLIKVERRQAIGRKLGIPLAAAVLKKATEPKEPRSPLAQIWRGVVAFAVLILAGAAVGAFFFPDRIPFLHRTGNIGVPVGVSDASSFASTPAQPTNTRPVVASQPVTSASPDIPPAQSFNAPIGPAASPANTASANANPSAQVASAAQTTEPAPPAQGPPEQSTAKQNADLSSSSSVQSSRSSGRSKKKTIASTSRSTSRRAPARRVSPREEGPEARLPQGDLTRARFVGSTPDGRMILRLPSGRTVYVTPRSNDDDVFVPPSHRRILIERPDIYAPPPAPLYPPDYPFND
jgi:serine/threonine protein kinase